MAKAAHSEFHFLASETVRDVVIGMSDGLTVPFALAAGLTGATAGGGIIVTAGLAEIAAGAVAMGLGGYLAARTDVEHYRAEYRRELRETEETPDEERREVRLILTQQGLDGHTADTVVEALSRDRHRWVDFMMRFELGLEKPDASRAPASALTIGISYIVGGSDTAGTLYAGARYRHRAEGVDRGDADRAGHLRRGQGAVDRRPGAALGPANGGDRRHRCRRCLRDRPRRIRLDQGRPTQSKTSGPLSTDAAMPAISAWKAGSFGLSALVCPEALATTLPPWNSATLTETLFGAGS